MKQIVRVNIKNWREEELLKKVFENLPVRIIKGFNSLIINPKSNSIKANKYENKYFQLLSILSILQQLGFKSTTKIINF